MDSRGSRQLITKAKHQQSKYLDAYWTIGGNLVTPLWLSGRSALEDRKRPPGSLQITWMKSLKWPRVSPGHRLKYCSMTSLLATLKPAAFSTHSRCGPEVTTVTLNYLTLPLQTSSATEISDMLTDCDHTQHKWCNKPLQNMAPDGRHQCHCPQSHMYPAECEIRLALSSAQPIITSRIIII